MSHGWARDHQLYINGGHEPRGGTPLGKTQAAQLRGIPEL